MLTLIHIEDNSWAMPTLPLPHSTATPNLLESREGLAATLTRSTAAARTPLGGSSPRCGLTTRSTRTVAHLSKKRPPFSRDLRRSSLLLLDGSGTDLRARFAVRLFVTIL
jgi:hypothetical protein